MFQVSQPYKGFCPHPKHFIVNCEQNIVKYAGKCGGKCNFYIKYFDNADRPYPKGTSASCPFDQQQNMLQPTTEYFIKVCIFCCHDQQQNADTTNN